MKLLLSEEYKDKFVWFLIKMLVLNIKSSINLTKLQKLQEVAQSTPEWKDIDLVEVIMFACDNFTFNTVSYRTTIQINPNIKYQDILLIDLCKFINYGNLNVSGYPIFTKGFEYIRNNIDNLILRFYRLYGEDEKK